jgi:Tfp pilus assembly protein PilX
MATLEQEAMSSNHRLTHKLISGAAVIFMLALILLVTIFLLAAISAG